MSKLAAFDGSDALIINHARLRAPAQLQALCQQQLLNFDGVTQASGEYLFLREIKLKNTANQISPDLQSNINKQSEQAVEGYSPSAEYAQAVSFRSLGQLLAQLSQKILYQQKDTWYLQSWQHLFRLPVTQALAQLWADYATDLTDMVQVLADRHELESFWLSLSEKQAETILHGIRRSLGFGNSALASVHLSSDGVEACAEMVTTLHLSTAMVLPWKNLGKTLQPHDRRLQLAAIICLLRWRPDVLFDEQAEKSIATVIQKITGVERTQQRDVNFDARPLSQSQKNISEQIHGEKTIGDNLQAVNPPANAFLDKRPLKNNQAVDNTLKTVGESSRLNDSTPDESNLDNSSPDDSLGSRFKDLRQNTNRSVIVNQNETESYEKSAPENLNKATNISETTPALKKINTKKTLLDTRHPLPTRSNQQADKGADDVVIITDDCDTYYPDRGAPYCQQGGIFYLLNFMSRNITQDYFKQSKAFELLHGPWGCLYRLADLLNRPADTALEQFIAYRMGLDNVLELETIADLPNAQQFQQYALKLYGAPVWNPQLLGIEAQIEYTSSHLNIHYPLHKVQLEVRRVGLDINPGWLPWLGQVVNFHYHSAFNMDGDNP